MKGKSIYIILIISLVILLFGVFYVITAYVGTDNDKESNLLSYIEEQDSIMHDMITDMMSIPESQSADIDYLNGMIPHHKSAIKMAESYLKYSDSNDEMKKLAENIIKIQSAETEYMESLLKTVKETDGQKELHYISEYNDAMHSSHSHSNNYDSISQVFAEGMTEHHQMAISMSEIILKYGDNENVKTLAKNIIESQQKEIENMNKFLQ